MRSGSRSGDVGRARHRRVVGPCGGGGPRRPEPPRAQEAAGRCAAGAPAAAAARTHALRRSLVQPAARAGEARAGTGEARAGTGEARAGTAPIRRRARRDIGVRRLPGPFRSHPVLQPEDDRRRAELLVRLQLLHDPDVLRGPGDRGPRPGPQAARDRAGRPALLPHRHRSVLRFAGVGQPRRHPGRALPLCGRTSQRAAGAQDQVGQRQLLPGARGAGESGV